MKTRIFTPLLFAASLFSTPLLAQKTWADIYTIMNTTCGSTVGGCHESGSSNPAFNVEAAPSVLYSQLINNLPTNPYAKDSVNNRIVDPFSPVTSFMMRKLSHCNTGSFSPSVLQLKQPFEGETMPENGQRIRTEDLELIYQWIVQGASETDPIIPDTVPGDLCDLNVGIEILPNSTIHFSAYPNPASENFTCSYTLEHPALVTMELLDVTGKNVKTLFNENQSFGKQVKTIVPEASQGIYFIRLTVGSTAQYMTKVALH